MQDRLSDLRQVVATKHPALAEQLPPRWSAIFEVKRNDKNDLGVFEAQLGNEGGEDYATGGFMAEYHELINRIKESIANIDKGGAEVLALKQQMMQTAPPEQEKALSAELQKVLLETNKHVQITRTNLRQLQQENEVFKTKNPNTSESRIRENMYSAMARKFIEQLTEYQTVQTEYKKSVKDKIERQIRIVCPEATENEVQDIIDSGDVSAAQQQIFARITGAHESLQYAYQEIQDKYRDVKRLEQSVAELHQMFVECAVLVEHQGEVLDQIDFAVRNAADYTEKADKDLVVAQKIQTRRKKWGCYLSCCLIFLVIIVGLPIIVFVVK